jgi:hypothetical protein
LGKERIPIQERGERDLLDPQSDMPAAAVGHEQAVDSGVERPWLVRERVSLRVAVLRPAQQHTTRDTARQYGINGISIK